MVFLSNEGILRISFNESIKYDKPNRIYPFENSPIYESIITDCAKLTKGDDVKDIYEIMISLSEEIKHDSEPGDTIAILPKNNEKEIDEILEILGYKDYVNDDCYFYVLNEKKRKLFAHLPLKSTLRNVFLENVDVRSPFKKTFLKKLSDYSTSNDKKLLEDLSSPKSENYLNFVEENNSLLCFLKKFSSCKPPIDVILENLHPLQPRIYSIASSPLIKNQLKLIFSVIINENSHLKGVCSSYLEKTALINGSIKFYFRKPSFRIQLQTNPVIMIGPGTGLAPFLSFLETLNLKNIENSDCWLFYGCRYNNRDFLYEAKLKKYLNDGVLKKLSVAFSRESKKGKIYVTHLIGNESDLIFNKFVEQNGSIYVCGDAKNMFKDVQEALLGCLVGNGMGLEEAERFLEGKIKEMKYIEDKWV
ncbi:methionine synthase reductase-like [Onthophagus taurus]|uniref:methionine synthase reductase-like n=1 Tax=Onthophagus taurus TaxID=166361 RepID=UPI0039BDFFC1